MKFEEVLPALREGKRIKRRSREYPMKINLNSRKQPCLSAMTSNGLNWTIKIGMTDIMAEDWEIVT